MMSLYHSEKSTHLELLPPRYKGTKSDAKKRPEFEIVACLLRASPQYFQVYRISREIILSLVA